MKTYPAISRRQLFALGALLLAGFLWGASQAGWAGAEKLPASLAGPFDLSAERTPQAQYFRMETRFIHIGFDGKRTGIETYVLTLKCLPPPLSGKAGLEYTCLDFRYKSGDEAFVTIPSLIGWSYAFNLGTGTDEAGQVFGIPHAKFENIADARGKQLPPGIRYAVYNNFIDFHGFNDIFARPMPGGRGIQDLKTIGQKIVHAAAFTEPPVNLGSGIKKGSVYRNGEVTLEFKGLSIVDGRTCALIGYDSGESTLKMIMPLSGDQEIVTTGGSEYLGDLYIDLETRWLRKATLDEFVVTRTTLPGPMPSVNDYTVRHILMRLISPEEAEKHRSDPPSLGRRPDGQVL